MANPLRPLTLAASQLSVATKPAVGYETRLFACPTNAVEIGTLELRGTNSGVWTESNEVGSYDSAKFVLAVLDTGYNGSAAISFAWGAASCAFNPASYHSMTNKMFPAGYAREMANSGDTAYNRPGGGPTPTCNADAAGVKVKFFALPSIDSFIQIGCKASLEFSRPTPEPASVQCGRDMSAYVKEGPIPVKTFNVVAKIPVEGDVIDRIDGQRVIMLQKIVKEDKVDVSHTYFMGTILKSTRRGQEAMEPDTLNLTGQYEDQAQVIADGP